MSKEKWYQNKLNWVSFFLVIFSATLWFFLWPGVFSSSQPKEKVRVQGAQAYDEAEAEKSDFFENVVSHQLFIPQPEAPIKKSNFGNTYVRARHAIALDAKTGTVLHFQEANQRTAIASLTKIMSAVVVMDEIDDLDEEIVTIDQEAFFTEGTKVGCPRTGYCVSNRLRVGEKISARALLEAMIMNSANDAAVALAKHIAGSQEAFARKMNKKAEALGLTDSHFCNPTGLDDEKNPGGCYSSAHDIARITIYSMDYAEIWQPMKLSEKEVFSADGTIKHRLASTNLLLGQMSNCLGAKTGFTYEAGKSLMMVAHHPETEKIKVVAVMIDDFYRWEDMPHLLNWSFEAYQWP